MLIYKLDGSKQMEMDQDEAEAVVAIWIMYGNSFTDVPSDYYVRINNKKVYLCKTTLEAPKTPENSELRLDI